MPISAPAAEIKAQFEREGYWIVHDILPQSEVQSLKEEIRSILAAVRLNAPVDRAHRDSTQATGVYVGLAARSERMREFARDPRILDLLEVVIGPNIAFLSDKIVFKSPEVDFGSPWHQDWPYWEGSHKLSVWLALDDANIENGCLKLLPGSHRTNAAHDGEAKDGHGFNHRLRQDAVDEGQAISAPIKAGSAVIFHDLTLHASHPNTSGHDRWALISTYRDAQAAEPFYAWAVAAEVVRGRGMSIRSEAV